MSQAFFFRSQSEIRKTGTRPSHQPIASESCPVAHAGKQAPQEAGPRRDTNRRQVPDNRKEADHPWFPPVVDITYSNIHHRLDIITISLASSHFLNTRRIEFQLSQSDDFAFP